MALSEESRIAVLEAKVDSILEQQKVINQNQMAIIKKMSEMDGARKLALWVFSAILTIGAAAGWFANSLFGKV